MPNRLAAVLLVVFCVSCFGQQDEKVIVEVTKTSRHSESARVIQFSSGEGSPNIMQVTGNVYYCKNVVYCGPSSMPSGNHPYGNLSIASWSTPTTGSIIDDGSSPIAVWPKIPYSTLPSGLISFSGAASDVKYDSGLVSPNPLSGVLEGLSATGTQLLPYPSWITPSTTAGLVRSDMTSFNKALGQDLAIANTSYPSLVGFDQARTASDWAAFTKSSMELSNRASLPASVWTSDANSTQTIGAISIETVSSRTTTFLSTSSSSGIEIPSWMRHASVGMSGVLGAYQPVLDYSFSDKKADIGDLSHLLLIPARNATGTGIMNDIYTPSSSFRFDSSSGTDRDSLMKELGDSSAQKRGITGWSILYSSGETQTKTF